MRTRSIYREHLDSKLLTKYLDGRPDWLNARQEVEPQVDLVTSDIVVNPIVDGYRKPSNYTAKTTVAGGNYPVLPGRAVPFPYGPVIDRNGTLDGFEGEAAILVPKSINTYPKGRPDELRTKLRNNVGDEIVDVAMVLAEIGQTAKTGGDIMLRIGRSIQAIGKRKKHQKSFEFLWSGKPPRDYMGHVLEGRSLDRFNRQTADIFLEWKYGIMPSVYDLHGITKGLDMNEDGSLWDHPPLCVARANVKYETSKTGKYQVWEPGGSRPEGVITMHDSVTHKARLDYRVEGEALRGLNRYGLGLQSLAQVAWDKRPFSFVFDMVCPIAQIIKAWGGLAGTTTVGYCETLYVERKIELGPPSGGRFPKDVKWFVKPDDVRLFNMERTAYGSVPVPLPYIRNPVKVGNMATVLALFTQMRPKGY